MSSIGDLWDGLDQVVIAGVAVVAKSRFFAKCAAKMGRLRVERLSS
jgi:hypothetical protein